MTATTIDVECPQCGRSSAVDASRRHAAEFCRSCDYPLFWAHEPAPLTVDDDTARLGRLPGAEGFTVITSVPCPSCEEPNALSAEVCLRCGAPMRPVPVTFVLPVVEPEPEEPEPFPLLVFFLGAALAFMLMVGLVCAAAGFD